MRFGLERSGLGSRRLVGLSENLWIIMVERVAGRRGASKWVLRYMLGEVEFYGEFGQCSSDVRLIKRACGMPDVIFAVTGIAGRQGAA